MIRQRVSGLRRQVPVPEQGASTRTRSASPARSASAAVSLPGLSSRGLDDGHAGALEPGRQPREASPIGVAGDQLALVRHFGGERERLAASASAKVDDERRRRRRAPDRDQLAAFVLNLDQPRLPGRARFDLHAFGEAQAERRPGRRHRVRKRRHHSFARRLQPVDRRSSGARSSSAGSSSTAIAGSKRAGEARPARCRRHRRPAHSGPRRPGRAASRRIKARVREGRATPPAQTPAPRRRGGRRGRRARGPRGGRPSRRSGGS